VTFFDGFVAKKWRLAPFWWFCYKEGDNSNVIAFLYDGGVVKKAMAVLTNRRSIQVQT
jgi:hypothetical protein